jgi:hypothetical protein
MERIFHLSLSKYTSTEWWYSNFAAQRLSSSAGRQPGPMQRMLGGLIELNDNVRINQTLVALEKNKVQFQGVEKFESGNDVLIRPRTL